MDPVQPRVFSAPCRRLLHEESGHILFESAVCYTLIFTLMLGLVQLCMMVYTYGVYSEAARAGVRYAVEHGSKNSSSCSGPTTGCSDSTGANVVAAVKTFASSYAATISGMKITASYPDSSSAAPSRVVVKITYTYVPFIKLPAFNSSFQITSQGRIGY